MAFLCPSRAGKHKEKKPKTPFLGRITGSSSIDTLVRVGLEKQHGLRPDARMVVSHDFLPCSDSELKIHKGQEVYVLYRENEWSYVISEHGNEGFVPSSFLIPFSTYKRRSLLSNHENDFTMWEIEEESEPECTEGNADDIDFTTGLCSAFVKKEKVEKYAVLFNFWTSNENDVSVERGEVVTVTNDDDENWLWIVKANGEEGFIPSSFSCPIPPDFYLEETTNDAPPLPPRDYEPLKPSSRKSSLTSNYSSDDSFHSSNRRKSYDNDAIDSKKRHLYQNNNVNIKKSSLQNRAITPPKQREPITATQMKKQHVPEFVPISKTTKARSPDFVKMTIVCDYTSPSAPYLSIKKGEIIFVDFHNQRTTGWLSVYSPSANVYINVPSSLVKEPQQLDQQFSKIALV